MDKEYFAPMLAMIIMLLAGLGIIAGLAIPAHKVEAYRQGQIDALTNTIKYELVSHGDDTVTWELIEKEED